MTLPKAVLGLTGAVFLFFGLKFLIDPQGMASLASIPLTSSTAITEIRAMYGGLEVGLGAFFLVAVFRDRWVRAALGAQVLSLGGLAGGRLIGVLNDPSNQLMVVFLALEAFGALVGLAAFLRVKRVLTSHRNERRILD